MDLRVTPQTVTNSSLSYVRRQYDLLAHYQEEASTGLKLLRPSDDPVGTVKVLNYKAQDGRLDTYLGNVQDATSKLNSSVATLRDVATLLDQARQAAQQGANDPSDPTANAALGQEVDSLLKRLINDANAQVNGEYLFGGTATGSPPFSVAVNGTVTYTGAAQRANVPVDHNETVDTFYTGSEVFQAGASGGAADAFQVLANVRDLLKNVTNLPSSQQAQALSASLTEIDRVRTNVLGVVGEQSTSLQNLEGLQNHAADVQLETKKLVGDLEGADISQVVLNLQSQQLLFQLTLASTAKLSQQQTLLDYLR
jgi:flagellar hook-associated protein 3 FlgL